MKPTLTTSLVCAAFAATTFALVAFAVSSNNEPAASDAPSADATDRAALVERGRYIVHGVGMCVDCHSPRNERGEFLEGKHLTGAPIPFAPTVPMPAWAAAAPRLAGLPAGYSEQDMIHFLTTGERPHGQPPARPPMPPYRMNRADAEAVVAYVHSLSAGTP
jgi:mono/diheme cytochrome c family protein